MKKIFRILAKGFNWYFNALVKTGAMCPSCMVPPISAIYMNRVSSEPEKSNNNQTKKAA